jgi:gamma-D-glutamyl-L-lysine dipeptidyl-peptidase
MKRGFVIFFLFMQLTNLFASAELDPTNRYAGFCRKIADRVGGKVDTQPAALQHCVERIRSFVLSDRVAFIFDVSAAMKNGRLVLTGESERPELVTITCDVFKQLGFTSVVDRVEILPDLKKDPAPFAVVVKPYQMTWPHPDLKGIGMDEALFGEPVYIFKELTNVYLIKNFSGYWGYAPKDAFRRVSKKQFIELINAPKALLLADYKIKDTFIPAGCRLRIKKWGAGRDCVLLGPSGQAWKIPKAICLRNDRKRDIARVLAQARSLLGAPYHMGGKNTVTGIDCSAFVQFAYRSLGINLARDAKQQYLNGDLILPCVADALQPGDAIFFMNSTGQVGHTALYLGDSKIIHAEGKCVKIQSTNPADTNYFKRFASEFIGAKRYWW